MRRADDRWIGGLRASLDNRDVGCRIDLHAVFQILDQRFRLVVVAEPMRGKRQQRARVGVELVPVGPEVLERFRLKLTNLSLLLRCMIHRERVQHPGLHVIVGFLFDQFLVQVTGRA